MPSKPRSLAGILRPRRHGDAEYNRARRGDPDRGVEDAVVSSARWKALRARVLRDEPLCRACVAAGRTELATQVDHVVPVRVRPVLLAGLSACQGVEFGVGVKPMVPPPDPAIVKQVEDAKTAVADAEKKAKEAQQLATDAEAARAAAAATAADLERKVASGEATQADLEQARRRASEAAMEATQAKERADRARAWTDDFTARATAASDKLTKAEAAWRDAAGKGLNVDGPKDTTPWGLLSWAISTGLLVVLNEKRKREAKVVLDAAKQESADVVARQDDAPFVGSGGKLEPEHRLADTPSRLDSIEAALHAAGVLKAP